MEVYWRLASADASERETAAVELARSLELQQQAYDDSGKKQEGSKEEKQKLEKQAKSDSLQKQENKTHRKRKGGHRELAQEQEEEATISILAEEKGTHDAKSEGLTPRKEELSFLSNSNTSNSNGNMLDGALSEEHDLLDCSPSVQYALRRLVRGVASSRECARQGFAMALACLLEAFPQLKTGSVLELICRTLEVTSSMKGQEKRDGLLGQLFALGAVISSRRPVANLIDMEDARQITERLLCLAKKKAFLREPAIMLLMEFFEKLPPDVLQNNILNNPLLLETLCMDIENANADTLLLALRLHKWLPYSVVESCPMLPNSTDIHAIFEPSHLLSIISILKDSSSCHPRVHLIWSDLVELLFEESRDQEQFTPSKKRKKRQKQNDSVITTVEERVAVFWSLVVDNSLLLSSHERKFLAMELVQLLLPRLAPLWANCILSKTVVRCLLDILLAEGNLLYKPAKASLALIYEWARTDEERIVTVVIALQHASHGKFDALSKTKTVQELVSSLKSKGGCFLLYNKLVELFNGENCISSAADSLLHLEDGDDYNEVEDRGGQVKDNTGSNVKSLETQRYWVLEQISSFVREVKDPDLLWLLQKEALLFFTANAIFVAPSGMKCHLKELQEEFQFPKLLSENTRRLCLARLQSLLLNMPPVGVSAVQDRNGTANTKLSPPLDPRFKFLELCDSLDNTSEVSRLQPVSEDEKELINAVRLCLSQLSMVTDSSNEQTQKIRAMCSLLMQLLLQCVTTGANDVTAELILCCKQAFGRLIKLDNNQEDSTEEPFFMDVLVEILLSLLAQSSASIRSAAEQVFKSFCGDLTESSMLSLLRVIKKQLNPGRRVPTTPFDIGDSDDDQVLEFEDTDDDSNVSDDNNVVTDRDDNNDDKDDESLVELQPKQPQISDRETEKNGLDAPVCDDEMNKDTSDSESSSDMDDEAMFKIDVHLENLLKQRRVSSDKGEGKDKQTQLLHFKFRVLSLLEYFFQKKTSSPLCLVSLPHLLQALVASSSAGGNAQLAERVSSVLQGKLFKSKDYPKGQEVDKAAVTNLLQRCMKLALRSKIKKVGQVLQSCSFWLMKVLLGQPSNVTEGTEVLERHAQEALNDFFYQRKCRLKAPFFRELFMRFPGVALTCLSVLLESCRNARTEFLQQEALQLVTFIFHFNCGKRNEQFKESLLQNLPAMCELLVHLIEKPPSNKVKKLEIRRYCVILLKAVAQELPEKPVKNYIGKSAYNLCLSHFGASITDGILKIKGANLVQDSENMKKKRSKQSHN
ncbi:hypothetical protein L7F22_000907 [Adiantum nelumboides]|nr:hypothetical protein [Adiantum nelumboides]